MVHSEWTLYIAQVCEYDNQTSRKIQPHIRAGQDEDERWLQKRPKWLYRYVRGKWPVLSKTFYDHLPEVNPLQVNRWGGVMLWHIVSTILVAAIHYFIWLFPSGTTKTRAPHLWLTRSPLKLHSLLLNRILQQLEYTTKNVYTVWVPFLHFPVFLANLCCSYSFS